MNKEQLIKDITNIMYTSEYNRSPNEHTFNEEKVAEEIVEFLETLAKVKKEVDALYHTKENGET